MFAATEALFLGCDTEAPPGEDLPARAERLLRNGCLDAALALLPDLDAAGDGAARIAAAIRLAVHDYEALAATAQGIDPAADPDLRAVLYLWRFETDDLEAVERLVEAGLAADPAGIEDLLAGARLALTLLEPDRAGDYLTRAESALGGVPGHVARWERLRSDLAYRRRDWDAALAHARAALAAEPLDADNLVAAGDALIRLGRTDEAVTAFTWAVRVQPLHERAHYQLGNGYARLNYTQLLEAYPQAFVDASTRPLLVNADLLYRNGFHDTATGGYLGLYQANPGLADVCVRLGSVHFAAGEIAEAKPYFVAALAACPEYGRAHNGLAKVLEAERLGVDVHRAAYEQAFRAATTPEIPQVNEFVTNWTSLNARHRKRVALSLEPWARYVPVLVAGGATFYIKGLHEKLSETAGQETLRDQRIGYDSRLWDDVRGCGGYNTVTGIEDVERTVYGGYDTVLHELTHQVHGVLTADRSRAIQELYKRTKERDAESGDAFLSRYAGGSVWEYFAEGANALAHPRRDRFDTREMLRERLEARDPDLVALVREIQESADVESCYAVSMVNQGDDRLRRGDAAGAMASYTRAIRRSPRDERALESLIHAHLVAGDVESAVDRAGDSAILHPGSGPLAVLRAQTFWFAGYGLDTAVGILEDAVETVRPEDRHAVWSYLGNLYWTRGDAAGAARAYAEVLAYQADSPEALWGAGAAAALAGDWDTARARYEEAVRHRTGVPELRAAYAWDLLRAGDPAAAREQVDAGLLLEPDSPELLALDGWLALEAGDAAGGLERARRALELGGWCDLALVVKARAELAMNESVTASATLQPLRDRIAGEEPPEYVFLAGRGEFKVVHELPAVLRELVPRGE